jgi:hypothetical protein
MIDVKPTRCSLVRVSSRKGALVLCAGTYRDCRVKLQEVVGEAGMVYYVLSANACEAYDGLGFRIVNGDFENVQTV